MKKKISLLFFAPSDSIHAIKWINFFIDQNTILHGYLFQIKELKKRE